MRGIEVKPEVAQAFNRMKLRGTDRYILFKIKSRREVVIDERGSPDKTFNDFAARLRQIGSSDCRYALYNFDFISKTGRRINKIGFFFWSPDNAPISSKMFYASTKDTVKKSFSGLSLEWNLNSESDIDYEAFRAEVERKA